MEKYLLVLLLIFMGAIWNVFLKVGLTQAVLPEINSLKNVFQALFILLKNHWIWLVILIYVPSALIYFYLLRKSELSYLFPILASATYVLVLLFSWIFLRENITLLRVMGILLVALGVFLVAKS
jgi:uncharacterized membrane protein